MITVPAHRIRQFGVEFYQAVFSAADIDRLVRFEVLGYGGAEAAPGATRRPAKATQVNWEVLEKRIGQSEAAYQRPVIRRKIQELLQYYRECREAGNLPAIPGAVIMISEKRLSFKPAGSTPTLGLLQIPEEPGVLRALDGQHRLLALHAAVEQEAFDLHVPAVLFDTLDARQVVELFVTINAKHTRLNPSHLLSLSGRRLYANPHQALAHDIIRHLNEAEDSPLRGDIRMLGVGKGKVTQAAINEEMVDLLEVLQKVGGEAKVREMQHQGKRFFLNYFKGVAQAFPKAWPGKKYSIKTGAALRAFVRVSLEVMARARELKGDAFDAHALRQAVAPWGQRLTDRRFETEGEWRNKLAGGTRGTVDLLARELKDALRRG
ncbi:MAG: DGQHR domain-containing protein [candidate division NC10 bacterium]|nr:DGQHR domain-containing protein [candidate division NC10 bacterium]